jgi:EAL domain-containing protein (putative c-di-GMP-specific phosphodiesterase class I)
MITAEDVRAGMERGELFIAYLPTVTLANARCIGAEALVRWRPGSEILPGGDFIPQIENTPMSGAITYWVIDTVATELGEWLGEHRDVHVSINVPPEILGRGGIEYAATRSGLGAHAGQIVLEITERGVPDRLGLEALNSMAMHGVKLALDDTMLTGANLALLARCNFKILKIDRELIAKLKPDAPAPAWLEGLGSLLRTSGLQVVAEGVESDYQAETLLAAGVQMGQGYLFSMPLTATELMRLYDEDRRIAN